MKAAYINRTGPPEIITYGDLPAPQPGPTQCLVKVGAADLNPIDTYIRGGLIPLPHPFPFIPGCDLAGTVVEVGPKVTRFKPGDRVWASNQGMMGRQGTFADLAAVEEHWLYPTPPNVSDETAAAVSLTAITAHLGLVRTAKLQSGEILFVSGGTGGVGSMVVQIAKALGTRVISTAGSNEKVAQLRELGADLAINYKAENVDAAIKSFAPNGVNLWWETVRDPDFDRAVSHLAQRGRMILMAGRDARPTFPVGPFYIKDCSLHGFAMFNASPDEQGKAAKAINELLAAGKLKANIGRILPLSEAAAAHRLQEENTLGKAGTLSGKIIVKP